MEQAKEQQRRLVEAGAFGPNKECSLYASVEKGDLIKYGRSRRGVQRYHCKSCQTTFTATRGTLFYRKRAPLKDILETLALLAEGVRISSLSRAKGFKEDTILRWLREAARHAEALEEVLMADYGLSKAQVSMDCGRMLGTKAKRGARGERERDALAGGAWG